MELVIEISNEEIKKLDYMVGVSDPEDEWEVADAIHTLIKES